MPKEQASPTKSASCFGRAYAVRSILFCSKCAQRRENRSQRLENRYRWCISNDQNIFEVHRGHRCFHGHGRAYEGSMSFAATRVKGADCHVVCCFSLAAMSRKRSTRRHTASDAHLQIQSLAAANWKTSLWPLGFGSYPRKALPEVLPRGFFGAVPGCRENSTGAGRTHRRGSQGGDRMCRDSPTAALAQKPFHQLVRGNKARRTRPSPPAGTRASSRRAIFLARPETRPEVLPPHNRTTTVRPPVLLSWQSGHCDAAFFLNNNKKSKTT